MDFRDAYVESKRREGHSRNGQLISLTCKDRETVISSLFWNTRAQCTEAI